MYIFIGICVFKYLTILGPKIIINFEEEEKQKNVYILAYVINIVKQTCAYVLAYTMNVVYQKGAYVLAYLMNVEYDSLQLQVTICHLFI